MNIKVERAWHSDTVRVWVYQRAQKLLLLRYVGPDTVRWDEVAEGEIIPGPTLELPVDVAALLGPELVGVLPPNEQMASHLKDALEVRDRLLTLVEKRR